MNADQADDNMIDRLFVRGDMVAPSRDEPLWPGRVNFGEISLFDGFPGEGKTTLVADLATRVTAGRSMPDSDSAADPASVLWLGAEDNSNLVADMLRVAGAVMERTKLYNKMAGGLIFPESIDFIEREVRRSEARLVVVDPLSAFVRCMNSEGAIRNALQPLAAMAERNRAAVILIRHLTKARSTRSVLCQGTGSVAIVALARNALLVGREPGESGRRVAAQFKSNAGPLSPTLAFNIVEEAGVRRVEWAGQSECSAEQILNDSTNESSALDEACMLLLAILSDGSKWVSDCKRIATKSGVAPSTLGRAKRLLKIKSRRKGFGKDSRVFIALSKDSLDDSGRAAH